jgi:hypothetical protein
MIAPGALPDMVRRSISVETIDGIIADLDRTFVEIAFWLYVLDWDACEYFMWKPIGILVQLTLKRIGMVLGFH